MKFLVRLAIWFLTQSLGLTIIALYPDDDTAPLTVIHLARDELTLIRSMETYLVENADLPESKHCPVCQQPIPKNLA